MASGGVVKKSAISLTIKENAGIETLKTI